MNWKEFFKLTYTKFILAVILLFLVSYIIKFLFNFPNTFNFAFGFPFPFLGEFCKSYSGKCENYIIYNIIIWYLISCLIVYLYNKTKTKE